MSVQKYIRGNEIGRESLILGLRSEPVAETHPSLVQEWLPDFFGPQCFSAGSGRMVWWHCRYGHYFAKKVSQRTKALDRDAKFGGCPVCAKRSCLKKKGLARLFPHLAAEWEQEVNGSPDCEPATSNRTVIWKCPRGHRFACMVYTRTAENQSCPECAVGKRINVSSICEHADVFFDHCFDDYCGPAPQPNLGYEVKSLPLGHKVWWKCKANPQHYCYRSASQLRDTGFKCPQCERECPGDLGDYPVLMAQFHRALNGFVNPLDLTANMAADIWWVCEAHPRLPWQSPIYKRTLRGDGCPSCAKALFEQNSRTRIMPAAGGVSNQFTDQGSSIDATK